MTASKQMTKLQPQKKKGDIKLAGNASAEQSAPTGRNSSRKAVRAVWDAFSSGFTYKEPFFIRVGCCFFFSSYTKCLQIWAWLRGLSLDSQMDENYIFLTQFWRPTTR